MILQFRMYCEEDDNFLRDYRFPAETTLEQVHQFVCADLHYNATLPVSYFTANEEGEVFDEYQLDDPGIPELPVQLMAETSLKEVIDPATPCLVFQFDPLNLRSLTLELTNLIDEEGSAEMIFANGDAPDQFNAESAPRSRSIFDEVMSDFDEFEGEDSYGDDE